MAGSNNINVTLSMKTSEFSKGLAKAKAETKSFGYEMGRAFGRAPQMAAKALAAGVVAGSVAMVYGSKKAFELGAGLKHLSDRTGIAVDSLAVMQQQFRDGGVDADSLAGSVNKLQRNLVDAARTGSGPAAQALAIFGENASNLVRMDPAEYFTRVGKGIASIKNPAVQASAAIALFGKQGGALLPMFKGEGFADAAQIVGAQAKMLKQNAVLFLDVNNRLSHAGVKLQGGMVGFAAGIAPGLNELLKRFDKTDFAGQGLVFGMAVSRAAKDFADRVGPLMTVMKGTAVVGGAVGGAVGDAASLAGVVEERTEEFFRELFSRLHSGIPVSKIVAEMAANVKAQRRKRDDEANAAGPASSPKQEVKGGVADSFFKRADPRGNFGYGVNPFGRNPHASDSVTAHYNSAVKRYGQKAVDLHPPIQSLASFINGDDKRMPHSNALSKSFPGQMIQGASGGLGASLGLSGGAYNASPLFKHRETMKEDDANLSALITHDGNPADIARASDARSNSGGYNVVRSGDHNLAKRAKQQAEKDKSSVEGSNKLLSAILQNQKKVWGEGE